MKFTNKIPENDGWYWLRTCGTLGYTVVFFFINSYKHRIFNHVSEGLVDIDDPKQFKNYDLETAVWSDKSIEEPEAA